MKKIVFYLWFVFLVSAVQPITSFAVSSFGSHIDGVAPSRCGDVNGMVINILGSFLPPIHEVVMVTNQGVEIAGVVQSFQDSAYVADWDSGDMGDIITVSFNLEGQSAGLCDIRVRDGLNQYTYGFDLVTIEEASPQKLWVNLTGSTSVRFGAKTDYFIWYGNLGNTDSVPSGVLLIGIPKALSYTLGFNPDEFAIPDFMDNTRLADNEFEAVWGQDYVIKKLYISDIPPMSVKPLKITIQWGAAPVSQQLKVWWSGGKPADTPTVWPAI